MNYKRILISEAEKRRIKHIHNVSRRNDFRNLLKEEGEYNPGVDPKVAEWFKNTISKELPGFPTDGYAFSIEDPAKPGTMVTVWEVLNPDNNLKYYLFTDGRAQNAKGEMAINKWHTDPAPTFDQTSQEGTSSETETKVTIDPNMSPEDVRKHIGNLRASYTRKTQELANLRKELEAERDAMVSQRQQTMNNPAYQKAVELANSEEQFDLYDPEGMKREIERQAAIQLKQMLEPAREQIKMEQRKVELQRFKDQNPELMDDAYRLPIAKMLHERPELRLEDAFYIVKAKVGAEKLEAEKRQMEAQRASRRETLKKTSTGANATPKGSPKFKDAWAAYQYHKAQQDKM